MASIVAATAEATCSKCVVSLESEALRCSRCLELLHFRCSDLPVYMLLRYKTSQAKYICRGCVLGEGDPESLNKASQDIEALMNLEEKTVKAAEADASFVSIDNNLAIQEKRDGGSKEAETFSKGTSVDRDAGSVTQRTVSDKADESRPVCKFYLRKSCKHGKMGNGCDYRHPKLCFKFIKRGEKRGGCDKGAQCQYVHPQLCRKALATRTCMNKNCRFYHVSGTKFSDKNSTETPDNSAQQSTINSERHANNVGSRPHDSTGSYTRVVRAEAPTIQHSNQDVFVPGKIF